MNKSKVVYCACGCGAIIYIARVLKNGKLSKKDKDILKGYLDFGFKTKNIYDGNVKLASCRHPDKAQLKLNLFKQTVPF